MALDTKTTETLSVNAVRESIVLCENLDQFINDNDKEPSWDGFVYIYKDGNKRKDHLIGRIPVQIKGTENSDSSKEEISYPVSVIDLKNYLNDGGIVFFVVYIGFGGLSKQIYYSALTPIKIRQILENAVNQKSKNIKLKKFPSNADKKTMIIVNCFQDCKKQKSFSNAKLLTLKELEKQGVLEGITAQVLGTANIDFKTALFENEVYMYANVKGSAIPQPLEIIAKNFMTIEEQQATVYVDERLFYDKVDIYEKKDNIKIVFGESFSITENKNTKSIQINYNGSNKIRTLVIDLDFVLSAISKSGFKYNGVNFPLKNDKATYSNFLIQQETTKLEFFKKVVKLLDMLNCKKDIDISKLNNKDWNNLRILVDAIVDEKEIQNLKEDLPSVIYLEIGNLNFILYFEKVENRKGTYRISDFFKEKLVLVCESSTGELFPISQYEILQVDDIVRADNIRIDDFLHSFQSVEKHKETMIRANSFLLKLIAAYDQNNERVDIITSAKDFSNWIMKDSECKIPYEVKILNHFQIEKRLRTLSKDEIQKINNIIDNPNVQNQILVGAYLLLEQQDSADFYFQKLSEEEKNEFVKYPIYHFWK